MDKGAKTKINYVYLFVCLFVVVVVVLGAPTCT